MHVCPMFAFDDAVFYYIAYLLAKSHKKEQQPSHPSKALLLFSILYDLLSLHLHIVRKLYFYFHSLSLSQLRFHNIIYAIVK